MKAESIVALIGELVDIKVRQQQDRNIKSNPAVAKLLEQKRSTDRRRIDEINAELTRLLSEP